MVRVWDVDSGGELFAGRVGLNNPNRLAFSSDGSISRSRTYVGETAAWDSRTGKRLAADTEPLTDAIDGPDGRYRMEFSRDDVRVIDTLRERRRREYDRRRLAAWAAGGD